MPLKYNYSERLEMCSKLHFKQRKSGRCLGGPRQGSKIVAYPWVLLVYTLWTSEHFMEMAENIYCREYHKMSLEAFSHSQSAIVSSIKHSTSSIDNIFLKWFLWFFFGDKFLIRAQICKNTGGVRAHFFAKIRALTVKYSNFQKWHELLF